MDKAAQYRRYRQTDKGKAASRRATARYRQSAKGQVAQLRAYAKRYGLAPEQYAKALESPCGICGAEAKHRDHDHATGIYRGALCHKCNIGLGAFRDDPALLAQAIAYLLRADEELAAQARGFVS